MSEEQTGLEEGEENFAEMLEKSLPKRERMEPGRKIEARIVKISNEWAFIDLGGKGEGCIDRKELCDADGALKVKEGDVIAAYFLSSKNNETLFTVKAGIGPAGHALLEDAWRNGVPVEGSVAKEIKGGFEIKIAGALRAFCPFSQMGMRREEPAAGYVGKSLLFKIAEFSENGRNIVLTRRPLLEEEQRARKAELKESLTEGMRLRGKVTSIQNFGAFVLANGIEGLLPISELSYSRVGKVSDVLSPGQEIEVAVKKLDWENEKFSFSLKDILTDPWDVAEQKFPVGSFHTGTVNRLAPFGAFVNLGEGIDGLLHISKLGGGKRLSHPKEAVKEGQSVEVLIEAVDREKRRISLALAEVSRAEAEAAATIKEFKQQQTESVNSMGTFGDLLKEQMEKKK